MNCIMKVPVSNLGSEIDWSDGYFHDSSESLQKNIEIARKISPEQTLPIIIQLIII
jgi:hypothetical protein